MGVILLTTIFITICTIIFLCVLQNNRRKKCNLSNLELPPLPEHGTLVIANMEYFNQIPVENIDYLEQNLKRIFAISCKQNNGYHLQQSCDHLFAFLFLEAVDALDFTIHCQTSLKSFPWRPILHTSNEKKIFRTTTPYLGPRISFGIHTGKLQGYVNKRMNCYCVIGSNLSCTAQLALALKGGLIVLTEQAYNMILCSPKVERFRELPVLDVGEGYIETESGDRKTFHFFMVASRGGRMLVPPINHSRRNLQSENKSKKKFWMKKITSIDQFTKPRSLRFYPRQKSLNMIREIPKLSGSVYPYVHRAGLKVTKAPHVKAPIKHADPENLPKSLSALCLRNASFKNDSWFTSETRASFVTQNSISDMGFPLGMANPFKKEKSLQELFCFLEYSV
eukprot:TRINITY_DN2478_c0_g1_i1.p1 TRINITY_DN2478_c0_g1~~TRINITY_DN2478_c0_g1_i1.p1  ORF type:complete len:403 (-),score=62.61 TRINITY_DN2478_c0_g1_i1:401-1582(-)